jgi:hypothetical protein
MKCFECVVTLCGIATRTCVGPTIQKIRDTLVENLFVRRAWMLSRPHNGYTDYARLVIEFHSVGAVSCSPGQRSRGIADRPALAVAACCIHRRNSKKNHLRYRYTIHDHLRVRRRNFKRHRPCSEDLQRSRNSRTCLIPSTTPDWL